MLKSTKISPFLVKSGLIIGNFWLEVKFRAFLQKFRARIFLKVHLQLQ